MNSYRDLYEMDSFDFKVVRIFLLAFVILLIYQTLQFINLQRIDKKHSELLVIRQKSIEEVQNLLIQSSTIQRKLLNLALTNDPVEISELKKVIENSAISNDKSLDEVESSLSELNSSKVSNISELKEASKNYKKVYTSFMDILLSGNVSEALEFKNAQLRPAYELYQEEQQQTLVRITDDLIMQSNRLSSYSTVSSWIMFFVGLAPFIYATLKLIYLSLFLRLKTKT